jgi:hypothetical protein
LIHREQNRQLPFPSQGWDKVTILCSHI